MSSLADQKKLVPYASVYIVSTTHLSLSPLYTAAFKKSDLEIRWRIVVETSVWFLKIYEI